MSVHALTERAMVMNLSISRWEGKRLDKEASQRVTEEAGARADAARVNKHLVPKEALAPVMTAANVVRDHFYTSTLPWRDNGDRLMPRKLFTTFIERHEELKREFESKLITLVDRALSNGRDPAQIVYNRAKKYGFASSEVDAATKKLQAIGRSNGASKAPTSSGAKAELTIEAVNKLSGAAFDKAVEALRRQQMRG